CLRLCVAVGGRVRCGCDACALVLVFVLLCAWACFEVGAAPFFPADDAQVLERLPFKLTDPGMSELMLLRAHLAQQPENLPLAVELARRYLELGRVSGDPRYAGYAQAALSPWWSLRAPPRDVLVLRATLHQRVHEFDAALTDLGTALERNPGDAQARLTLATVLQVRGEFESARREGGGSRGSPRARVWRACLAGGEGSRGRWRRTNTGLRGLFARTPEPQPSMRAWVLTSLAEMAARAGLFREADTHFHD